MNVYSSEFVHIVEFADKLNLMCLFLCLVFIFTQVLHYIYHVEYTLK